MIPRLAPSLAIVALLLTGPARSLQDPAPVVYAHRGGADLAPENTLGAFRQAHALYGDAGVWLEMDAQLAKDGELVVIHDATLDRTTTNCSGRVVDKTSVELLGCDATKGWPDWPAPEPVPTARRVLTEGRDSGWRVMIEIKNIPGEPNFDPAGTAAAAALLDLVDEVGFPHADLLVQSFFPTSLDAIELHSDIGTALLTTSRLPGAPPGAGFYAIHNGIYATARGYEVTAPDHSSPDLSATTVGAIHALGRRVVVWTVDAPADIERAIGWGVDGVISNRPDLAYAALG